jgi:hypothetical protein
MDLGKETSKEDQEHELKTLEGVKISQDIVEEKPKQMFK